MKNIRIAARLDIKSLNVIKGIQFECLRVVGKPSILSEYYYNSGIDEIIFLDTVANLYNRSKLTSIVNEASKNIHIPLTAGGGVKTIQDFKDLLKAGADKVFINSYATKNPQILSDAARVFGSQCIVLSVEAKRISDNKWEAYIDSGRERTGKDVMEWVQKAEELGVGEIFLTSVDRDGTKKGLDDELIENVSMQTNLSLVVSGGFKDLSQIKKLSKISNIDCLAIGSALHYDILKIEEIKKEFKKYKFLVRGLEKSTKKNKNPKLDINLKKDYNYYSLNQMNTENLKVKKINLSNFNFNIKKNNDFEIGVINFGVNNLQSVISSLKKTTQKKVSWIDSPTEIEKAKVLILPGIGAFGWAMNNLKKLKILDSIIKNVNSGKPILGICLGMQLLFDKSFEFGEHNGLGLLEGNVSELKKKDNLKIPHIGWNKVFYNSKKNDGKLIESSADNLYYFVHSFKVDIPKRKYKNYQTKYGDNTFCSAIEHKNIFGVQFHPEKSGNSGIKVLNNFLKITI